MIHLTRRKHKPLIPMSSMSDIGFLLLIFIMLISLINQRHEVKIEYSEAMILEKTQEKENLEIWIEKSGIITVDAVIVSPVELEAIVAKTLSAKPETRVHIIADRNTSYRHVNKVIGILQTLQHRVVSFVVKEELR